MLKRLLDGGNPLALLAILRILCSLYLPMQTLLSSFSSAEILGIQWLLDHANHDPSDRGTNKILSVRFDRRVEYDSHTKQQTPYQPIH